MAVTLLITIAAVLAWGTIYEARFGTAAVQHWIYQAWWFQGLLAFLGLNLSVAALERWPWRRRHLPFLLAHLGIILILAGAIVGAWTAIDGQLVIPEGQTAQILDLQQKVLVVRQPNPGMSHIIPTAFDASAWAHEPNLTYALQLEDRQIDVLIDQYFPDAKTQERVTDAGVRADPAIQVRVERAGQEDTLWLLAHDPERFVRQWNDVSVYFLEPQMDVPLDTLFAPEPATVHQRGVVSVQLPNAGQPFEVTVPEILSEPIPLGDTPYVLEFQEHFTDLAVGDQGPFNRSDLPNNPAIALTLSGPEGADGHLLFAFHPDFPALHGHEPVIDATLTYVYASAASAPPFAIVFVTDSAGSLSAIATGDRGQQQMFQTIDVATRYQHPWLGVDFTVEEHYTHAEVHEHVVNGGDEVRAEAVHLVIREGGQSAEAWIGFGQAAEVFLPNGPVSIEYRHERWQLPVAVKLLDFRRIDYPDIQMAWGFESDVELTDSSRGVTLRRTISMNQPLKYRGYSFFQSSYLDGPVETTILSVRNDPGTPLVFAGYVIVTLGIIGLFISRRRAAQRGMTQ